MSGQIKTMESQIEALMKENEELRKAQPMVIPTVIPTVNTAIPSTLAEHLAPNGVLPTAVPITSLSLPLLLHPHRGPHHKTKIKRFLV